MMKVIQVVIGCAMAWMSHVTLAADRLVPAQYPTIQAAISAAVNGDVVQISPGSYAGPINPLGKAITIRGTSDASSVLVTGGDSVIQCVSAETASTIFENLTITGGTGSEGAGIRIINASPVIRACRVISNTASGGTTCRGGGIFISGGAARLESCLIGGNSVISTGGPCHPNCNCGAQATSNGYGGGIYMENSTASVISCTISGNLVRGISVGCNAGVMAMGGGIFKTGSLPVVFENCSISTNVVEATSSASCNGPCCTATGGAAVFSGPTTVTQCRISNNSRSGCGELVGGVKFDGTGTVLQTTRLCGNTTINYAGAFIDAGGNVIASTCPASCTTDFNGDGFTDGADLGVLLSRWGPCTN